MNRDQVHAWMTGLSVCGSIVGGIILTNHQVAEHSTSFGNLPSANPTSSSSTSPSSSASASTSSSSSSSGPVTKQGDIFTEQVFGGQVQVSVTKTDGKITNINLDTATATGGRKGLFHIWCKRPLLQTVQTLQTFQARPTPPILSNRHSIRPCQSFRLKR